MPDPGGACETCRWWRGPMNVGSEDRPVMVGNCKRFPPSQPAEGRTELNWRVAFSPVTLRDDWCGEYQVKSEAANG